MDILQEAAAEFAKLFGRDYIYELENGIKVKLFFAAHHFHHLAGLQKLRDIPAVKANPKNNSAGYIFKNILKGTITLEDIKKSLYFNEIEPRLRHFTQINRIVESAEIVFEFDPALINSKNLQAGRILFKMSNDNLYLNLLLKTDSRKTDFYIAYTFIPRVTDDYTHEQKGVKIQSRYVIERFQRKT